MKTFFYSYLVSLRLHLTVEMSSKYFIRNITCSSFIFKVALTSQRNCVHKFLNLLIKTTETTLP